MSVETMVATLNDRIDDGFSEIAPGLGVVKSAAPYDFEALIYEPLVCLILQGAKETVVGGVATRVGPGQLIVVSHALPVTSRVVEASRASPYLALVARLDLGILRSVMVELDDPPPLGPSSSFATGVAQGTLVDVFQRYVGLGRDPVDARVLGGPVRRELHYRLLRSDSGGMLRSLFDRTGHSQSISRAIQELRQSFREPMEMDLLAQTVGMSVSSFYKHFKAITMTTPLQYQKDLRLTEAQRLLLAGQSVSAAAFAVGYRSPSQFSRDFGRRFGSPPSAARASA